GCKPTEEMGCDAGQAGTTDGRPSSRAGSRQCRGIRTEISIRVGNSAHPVLHNPGPGNLSRPEGAKQCQCSIPSFLSNVDALYRTRLYAPYTAMVPERRKPKPLQSDHPLPQLHA